MRVWRQKVREGKGGKVRKCGGKGVYFLPVERSSLESVCNASMISEKVPWEHKWLHETGGRRRCGDNIKHRPEAIVPYTECAEHKLI